MIRGDLLINDQFDLRVTCLCDTSCKLARKSRAGQVRYRERSDRMSHPYHFYSHSLLSVASGRFARGTVSVIG